MRAEKRKKNAPKELARLKTALALGQDGKGNITMKDIEEIAILVPAENIKDKQGDDDGKMDMDNQRNKKTQLDEHGQYPNWMSQRQAKKLKGKRVTKKGVKAKKKNVAW